ncbi:hypothetical protein LXL04_038510 [Taraxacum kok-saghyz]
MHPSLLFSPVPTIFSLDQTKEGSNRSALSSFSVRSSKTTKQLPSHPSPPSASTATHRSRSFLSAPTACRSILPIRSITDGTANPTCAARDRWEKPFAGSCAARDSGRNPDSLLFLSSDVCCSRARDLRRQEPVDSIAASSSPSVGKAIWSKAISSSSISREGDFEQ